MLAILSTSVLTLIHDQLFTDTTASFYGRKAKYHTIANAYPSNRELFISTKGNNLRILFIFLTILARSSPQSVTARNYGRLK
jgi:hypothetical protein